MSALRFVPALALLAACATSGSLDAPAPTAEAGLPFVTDFAQAKAEAMRRGVPIFVDAWAPW